jgi:hypothetical protein
MPYLNPMLQNYEFCTTTGYANFFSLFSVDASKILVERDDRWHRLAASGQSVTPCQLRLWSAVTGHSRYNLHLNPVQCTIADSQILGLIPQSQIRKFPWCPSPQNANTQICKKKEVFLIQIRICFSLIFFCSLVN